MLYILIVRKQSPLIRQLNTPITHYLYKLTTGCQKWLRQPECCKKTCVWLQPHSRFASCHAASCYKILHDYQMLFPQRVFAFSSSPPTPLEIPVLLHTFLLKLLFLQVPPSPWNFQWPSLGWVLTFSGTVQLPLIPMNSFRLQKCWN